MSIYFDTKIKAVQPGLNTGVFFHEQHSILAVTTYNQGAGGAFCLFNGEVGIQDRIELVMV